MKNTKRLEKLSKLRKHPDNPRVIRDDKFKKLVKSINEFPEMLEMRPLIVNKKMQVLGGNMRLRAAQDAGHKEIWIDETDWSEEKQREFIIKDNSGFGQWDWDLLANEWNEKDLEDWGLDLIYESPEEPSFDELNDIKKDGKPSIKITFDKIDDLEKAELSIKEIIKKYKNSFYSVS